MTLADLMGKSPGSSDDINRDDTNGHDMDAHVPNDHNDHDSCDEVDSQAVDNNDEPAGVVPQVAVNNSYNDLGFYSSDHCSSK